MSKPQAEPKLGPPGAGLPLIESLIARFYYGGYISVKSDWESNREGFARINQKILNLVEGLSEEKLATRVLVPRLQGLEDSSRFWSVAMALEHLYISGTNMAKFVVKLSNGEVPAIEVDIAKVKPPGAKSGAEILANYKVFLEKTLLEIDRGVKDRNSRTRLKHPWFGALTAKQWQWLMLSHSHIHYRQIKLILKELSSA
jgi:hypothetical protein